MQCQSSQVGGYHKHIRDSHEQAGRSFEHSKLLRQLGGPPKRARIPHEQVGNDFYIKQAAKLYEQDRSLLGHFIYRLTLLANR